jgi:hypothetical protein
VEGARIFHFEPIVAAARTRHEEEGEKKRKRKRKERKRGKRGRSSCLSRLLVFWSSCNYCLRCLFLSPVLSSFVSVLPRLTGWMGRNRNNNSSLWDVDGLQMSSYSSYVSSLIAALVPQKQKRTLHQKWRSMLVLPLEVNNNGVVTCLALFCVVSCCIAWCRPVLPSGREDESLKEISTTSFSSFKK